MDTKLLELLVCPVTKGPLRLNREDPAHQELISKSARLAYPIRDGIHFAGSRGAGADR